MLCLLLAIVTIMTIVPIPIGAEDTGIVASGECGQEGSNVTWTLTEDGTLTIEGEGAMIDSISAGSAPWADYSKVIYNINIAQGVTSIGGNAFASCKNLTNVYIPDSVTSIESFAFVYCTNLTNVYIPDSVTSIESFAFANCTSLTNVYIPDSVTSIGNNAFYRCTSLTDIDVGSDNNYYGSDNGVLFNADYSELIIYPSAKSNIAYIVPNSVTSIESFAFYNCTNLANVYIPNSVTSIGGFAFAYCTNLTNVYIPDSVNFIGLGAFSGCTNLINVHFPYSVTSIDSDAFYNCTSLTNVYIPNSVTSIGNDAFYNCTSLTNVYIPNSVTSIGNDAFRGCDNLADVYYSGTENEWKTLIADFGMGYLSATIHYNATGSEVMDPSYSGQLNENTKVRRFSKWDAEKKIVYFDEQDIFGGYAVNEETDTSFLENIDELLGKHVLVEAVESVDGYAPGTLISIKPVDVQYGTLEHAYDTYWVVDGAMYPVLRNDWFINGAMYHISSDVVVECYLYNGGIAGFNYVTEQHGYVKSWDPNTNIIEFDPDGNASPYTKRLSTEASESTIDFLNSIIGKEKDVYVEIYAGGDYIYSACKKVKPSEDVGNYYYPPLKKGTEEEEILLALRDDFEDAFDGYMQTLIDVVEKYSKKDVATRESIIEAQAAEMQKADKDGKENYLTFISGFNNAYKDEAYKALAEFMYDNAVSNPSFANLDLSDMFVGANLVNTVMRSMSNTSAEYSYGNVVVAIKAYQFGNSKFGELYVYPKDKPNSRTNFATICSTQADVLETLNAYVDELYHLGMKSYRNVYAAMCKDILGKPLSSYTKDYIDKSVSKYAEKFTETGIGNLCVTLNQCYNYYLYGNRIFNHVKEVISENDREVLETLLLNMNGCSFEDTTIKDRVVNKAYKKVKNAAEKFNIAVEDYIAGNLHESEWDKFWKFVFACPVSIKIYNSNGIQIGYVGEDDIWYTNDLLIEEKGGAKIITSYINDELSFEIMADDYGVLSCSIEEYTDGNTPAGRLNFYEIPLEPDKVLALDVENNIAANRNSTVISSDEEKIFADEYIHITEDGCVTVSCDIQYEANEDIGTIYGAGKYVKGDAVVLIASPKEGYDFIGWYDGECLVCTNLVYEFVAKENLNLTAVFCMQNIFESEHLHDWSSDWSFDSKSHWHECTDSDCDKIADKSEHILTLHFDVTYHWYECSVCGAKFDVEAHKYESGKCTVCNAEDASYIPPVETGRPDDTETSNPDDTTGPITSDTQEPSDSGSDTLAPDETKQPIDTEQQEPSDTVETKNPSDEESSIATPDETRQPADTVQQTPSDTVDSEKSDTTDETKDSYMGTSDSSVNTDANETGDIVDAPITGDTDLRIWVMLIAISVSAIFIVIVSINFKRKYN